MDIKVSVVVPVYNVERYLKKCLYSIINQTYKNIEILLIDDGSKDSSGTICDAFAQKDKRIQVIHQLNIGLSGARNSALDIAKGEYVICIDSDDFVSENIIEILLNSILENNCDIAVCGTIFCDEDNKVIKEHVADSKKLICGSEQLKNLLTCFDISTTAWGKLYKRNLFNHVRYPLGKYNEDIFTTYKLLDVSKKTIVINDGLYYYRQVSNSIMHAPFSLKHLDAIEGSIKRAIFISKKYPQYKSYAYATVVYACCKNYERMILSVYKNKQIENYLQNIIRKYTLDFILYSKAAIKTKIFSLVCSLNMKLGRMIYKNIVLSGKE